MLWHFLLSKQCTLTIFMCLTLTSWLPLTPIYFVHELDSFKTFPFPFPVPLLPVPSRNYIPGSQSRSCLAPSHTSPFLVIKYNTPLTSTGWVRMTIKPCIVHTLTNAAVIKSQWHRIFLDLKNQEHWESNPGRLGVERERYLCAMLTPPFSLFTFSNET